MKYNCGHLGCDICGGRECARLVLKKVGEYIVCDSCLHRAIWFTVLASQSFSTFLDLDKKCGYKQ